MQHRVLALARAGLAQHWAGGAVPAAPLIVHGSAAAVSALLVNDVLPPFAYALAMLALSAALIALPLLGDVAPLLRSDPAEEWLAAQPVTPREIRLARSLVAVTVVGSIAAAALLPMALFAPASMDLTQRALLFATGLGQALAVTAALLAVLSVLGGRAESVLVALQTVLFGGVVLGALLGLRHVAGMARVTAPGDGPAWLPWFPPAWFAGPFVAAPSFAWRAAGPVAVVAALVLLWLAPAAPAARASRRSTLGALLEPLRALAARTWVRVEERASFDLVWRVLPLERDVVLRTYPLVGIPLAFVLAGSRTPGPERDALLTLLLFMPPIWMPVLLVHVPACASHEARWLLEGAPTDPAHLHAGARKAVTLRFLLPLYAALFALAAWQAGVEFAARVAIPAALLSVLLLRPLYRHCVHDTPLSRSPDDLLVELDWTGVLLGAGMIQVVFAVLAWKFLAAWPVALAVCAGLVALEWLADRRERVDPSRAAGRAGA